MSRTAAFCCSVEASSSSVGTSGMSGSRVSPSTTSGLIFFSLIYCGASVTTADPGAAARLDLAALHGEVELVHAVVAEHDPEFCSDQHVERLRHGEGRGIAPDGADDDLLLLGLVVASGRGRCTIPRAWCAARPCCRPRATWRCRICRRAPVRSAGPSRSVLGHGDGGAVFGRGMLHLDRRGDAATDAPRHLDHDRRTAGNVVAEVVGERAGIDSKLPPAPAPTMKLIVLPA